MKFFGCILLGLLMSCILNAQTVDEIKNSTDYIWGSGTSQNVRNADKEALEALIQKISLSQADRFKNITTSNDELKNIIETYHNTIQQQTKRIANENSGKTEVLRYISENDLNSLFEGRKNKILEYTKLGDKNLDELQIADALRYYYWSLVLLRTHPLNSELKYKSEKDNETDLLTELPAKIIAIFNNIEIHVKSIDDNNNSKVKSIYFEVNYKGKPVENFDYTYWNGKTWTNLVSSKNGDAYAEFPGPEGKSLGSLRIKAEYIFESKSKMDLELYNVIQNTDIPYFSKSEIDEPFMKVIGDDVSLTKDNTKTQVQQKEIPLKSESQVAKDQKQALSGESKEVDNLVSDVADETPYRNLIDKFTQSIETKNYSSLDADLTENGKDGFDHLIKYGNAKIIDKNPELKFIKFENSVLVRSLPMIFSFKNNDRQFVEDVTFTINKDLKIDNIAFSLSRKALDDIMSHSKWPEENKLQLIQFMENYKTAYALERIDYIESIFSNDALIIIGRVLEKAEPLDGMYGNFKNDIEYIRLSKAEYIDRLKTVFNQNEFVNIQFEDNEIRKKNNSDEYGIQIVQNYYSTNYADKGYLFLYIDMRDSLHPRILVRSWQPEKNADGSVPGLSDFF